jgi:hypothetical protein
VAGNNTTGTQTFTVLAVTDSADASAALITARTDADHQQDGQQRLLTGMSALRRRATRFAAPTAKLNDQGFLERQMIASGRRDHRRLQDPRHRGDAFRMTMSSF